MKIELIEFKNYRQWQDTKIAFSFDPEKNVSIIQGAMGAGKTNILNAITWCLYGRENHLSGRSQSKGKSRGLPIINSITANNLEPQETSTVEVVLQFKDKDSKKLIIGRKIKFQKKLNGEIIQLKDDTNQFSKDGTTLWVYFQKGRDIETVEFPEVFIQRLIPESIQEYFFFDGERITEYFNIKSIEKIKDAVFNISQIDLLETTIDHLSKIDDFLLKNKKDLSGTAEVLRDSIAKNEKALEELKDKRNHLDGNFKDAEIKMTEYSLKLSNTDIGRINFLQKEKAKLMKRIDDDEKNLQFLKDNLLSKLIDDTPKIFSYLPLQKMQDLLVKSGEAGQMPPDIKKVVLRKMLDTGRCLCGCNLEENYEHRKTIQMLYDTIDDITNISEEIIKESINVSNCLEDILNFEKDYINTGKNINQLETGIRKNNGELTSINTEIGNCDIENIQHLHRKFTEYDHLKNNINQEIGRTDQDIKNISNETEGLKTDLEKELKKESRNKVLLNYIIFCKKCSQILIDIKNEIMEEVREEIEKRTKDQFFELMWKKVAYKDIKIDSNYDLTVINRDGLPSLDTLSKGETQVLALSFMAALNQVSGFDVPIIIDTPLGRISSKPKAEIAKNLSEYLKEKQVILLVTDEEYNSEVRKRLINRVCNEYIINFIETKKGDKAEVVEYGSRT